MLASLAKALSGNLTYSAEEERPLDKLLALHNGSIGPGRESLLNSLGVSLIAFKHAHRPDYHVQAIRQLGHALAWRKIKNRGAVAKTAVSEWVIDQCPTCSGAKQIADINGVMRPCLPCGQTGKRRYGDDERKGIPGKAMQEAHHLIALAISVAIRGAIRRLGRTI
jgi:hypothetical protein